ncbi:hypothetical protein Gotur_020876 [Gossypium turneri]
MESSSRLMKDRLGFFEIIQQSLKIPLNNPNFLLLTFLTSFPLFCFLVFYEIILQHTLIESAQIFQKTFDDYERLTKIGYLLEKVSPMDLFVCVLFMGTLHFVDLFNTIAIVDIASMIYAGEKPISLKHMICRSINETRFKGPLITSICSLSLAALVLLGLISFATSIYILASLAVFFMVIFMVPFIALLVKYLEWSAIWNMGIVVSILEDNKQGDVALLLSSYLSRCNRGGGFFLMLGFFVWRFGLRFAFLYRTWYNGDSSIGETTLHISLVCLGNLVKWVALMLYFYDFKKQTSSRISDVEDAKIQERRSAAT